MKMKNTEYLVELDSLKKINRKLEASNVPQIKCNWIVPAVIVLFILFYYFDLNWMIEITLLLFNIFYKLIIISSMTED